MKPQTKEKLKIFLQKLLRLCAILVLKKYKPSIIGITGSVGKTSAKEATYAILKNHFNVRRNIKNYNNELGVPLTILGIETSTSFVYWLGNLLKIFALLVFPMPYPKILILEVGVDKPGDMKYITDFVLFDIGIITAIGPAHIEFFGSLEAIAKEKGNLIKSLPKDGFAILNNDDDLVLGQKEKTKAKVLTFGFQGESDIKANVEKENGTILGLSFKMSYQGSFVPVRLPGTLGKHQIYAALAGAGVGIALGLNLIEIAEGLKEFPSLPGRMKLLAGIKGSLIIDDTYNSSPVASFAALEVLSKLPAPRKIAVLGDMLELGEFSEENHRKVGEKAGKIVNLLVTVGPASKILADAAIKKGLIKADVFSFDTADEAKLKVQELIRPGDLILVKGSQGMRMEKVVKEIMAEPEKAKELLVRQDPEWLRR